jgi:hypothetical protein
MTDLLTTALNETMQRALECSENFSARAVYGNDIDLLVFYLTLP